MEEARAYTALACDHDGAMVKTLLTHKENRKQEERTRLENAEMWFWRRMEKISCTKRVTNKEELRRTEEKRTLISTIYNRQTKWIGHNVRHQGIFRDVIEGRLNGKRSGGK